MNKAKFLQTREENNIKEKDELKRIRAKSVSELSKELNDNYSKLIEMKRNLTQDKLKKTSDITKTKKNIARIKTILREKLEEELKEKNG